MATSAESVGVSSAERALKVLLLFSRPDRATWGISEISRELDLAKGVTHRLVATLARTGLLEQVPATRRYRLGVAAWSLGQAYLENFDARDVAREDMRQLSEETGETISLAVRSGQHRVYLDQIVPDRAIALSGHIGEAIPLHVGAAGKVLLAYMDPRERDAYLSGELVALTDKTPVAAQDIMRQLEAVRFRGYALSMGERLVGVGAVAAPVLDRFGNAAFTLVVGGPIERIQESLESIVDALLSHTRKLSERIGATRAPGTAASGQLS
jgi:IclR family transcriptional regulator, acetate operon repressor